ncbi:MAG: hypothetical protein KAT07_08580, partial [Calditrichia bacterium]|nr:hypothetical protein [Calditrichia bacterium]
MKTKIQGKLMSIFLLLFFVMPTGSIPVPKHENGSGRDTQFRQISMEEYADKVAGGWMGQAIAVLWGQWTEGKWQGEM